MGNAECLKAPTRQVVMVEAAAATNRVVATDPLADPPAAIPRKEVIPDLEEFMKEHQLHCITDAEPARVQKAWARSISRYQRCCGRSASERIVRLPGLQPDSTGDATQPAAVETEEAAAEAEASPSASVRIVLSSQPEESPAPSPGPDAACTERDGRPTLPNATGSHYPRYDDWDFAVDATPTLLLARYKALAARPCRQREAAPQASAAHAEGYDLLGTYVEECRWLHNIANTGCCSVQHAQRECLVAVTKQLHPKAIGDAAAPAVSS
mmetsp:Transcript_82091/g.228827  ORF Transcript_82091/g.228827 Transcript_82091/m.228827 type:complete len:268 (-) Transcript_82091:68-871(-)